MDIKQKLKIYFEFEKHKEEIKKHINDLELEKQYILENLKALRISDMPNAHTISDISNSLTFTEGIDTTILNLHMQLDMICKVHAEIKEMIKCLTEQEMIVLERRIYGCKVFVINQRVHIGQKTYFRIRSRIHKKIGVEI